MYFERSIIYFLEQFRRIYVGDQALAKSLVYQKLSDSLGLANHVMYLEVIVRKIITNLNWWRQEPAIVKDSLVLFNDLAAGYSSGKLLSKLEIVDVVLTHHTVCTHTHTRASHHCHLLIAQLVVLITGAELSVPHVRGEPLEPHHVLLDARSHSGLGRQH